MNPGDFYHVFNHANGRENIFAEEKNYRFFLDRMAFHIIPVCRVYAYCLMKNHFHLLISVRTKDELLQLWQPPDTDIILDDKKLILKASKVFSNLFSIMILLQQLKSGRIVLIKYFSVIAQQKPKEIMC